MGMNAMNGVINIVTRTAGKTKGWFASVGSGSEDNVNTSLRYGGSSKGGKVDYRVYSKFFHRGDTLQTPTLDSGDTWKSFRGGARVDINASQRDTVSLFGDVFTLRSMQLINANFPTPGPGTTVTDPVDGSGGFILGRWERAFSGKSNSALQVFYDRNNRSELFGQGNWGMADLDFQHRYQWSSKNELAWGFGVRHNSGEAQGNEGKTRYVPSNFSENIFNLFLQDEYKLVPDKLAFTAGVRLLDSSAAKLGVQLTGRLNWTPTKTRTLWAGVSRSVHTSSFLDRSVQLEFPIPSTAPLPVSGRIGAAPGFDSEVAVSYEAGVRQSFGGLLIADAAGFVTHYDDLKQTSQGSPFREGNRLIQPFWWLNSGSATTSGAEFSTKWNLHSRWNLTANYTFFQIGGTGRSYLPGAPTTSDTSPKHQFFGRSSLTLPKHLNWDTSVQYVSRLASGIPSYTRVDTRLARAVREMGEWSVGFFNILDPHHPEYAPEDYSRRTLIQRSFYVRAVWGK
jgi:iron complex outermembrane receptor protein